MHRFARYGFASPWSREHATHVYDNGCGFFKRTRVVCETMDHRWGASPMPEQGCMPMIELFGDRTGNCLRVAIALEESGLPYVQRRINLAKGQHHGAPFLAINPAGKVPSIIDHSGGTPFVLSQSLAIMLWLAARVPGRLMPREGSNAYAIALERLFMVATDLIAPTHSASYLRATSDVIASRRLDGLVMARLGWMEQHLRRNSYLAGDQFTLADVSAVTLLASIHSLTRWRSNPRMADWYARVSNRESVIRGIQAFQTTPEPSRPTVEST